MQVRKDAKIQLKWEKRLCFWCDEKYTPTHCCKFWQLKVMFMSEDDKMDNMREEVNGIL